MEKHRGSTEPNKLLENVFRYGPRLALHTIGQHDRWQARCTCAVCIAIECTAPRRSLPSTPNAMVDLDALNSRRSDSQTHTTRKKIQNSKIGVQNDFLVYSVFFLLFHSISILLIHQHCRTRFASSGSAVVSWYIVYFISF